MAIQVRQAELDDTGAISALFRGRIGVWQRLTPQGRVEDVPYEALTIYERWLHGGAWMSVETGAIFLNHLLSGAGIALVAQRDRRVLAYAEAYHGVEPEPFGSLLHLEHLVLHPDGAGMALEDALLTELRDRAQALKASRVTINRVSGDIAIPPQYALKTLSCLRRYTIPARQGQVFYRSVEHLDPNPAQVANWTMPVGRFTSSRHQWEMLMPRTWETLPEMRARRTNRQKFSTAGQDAYVVVEQQLFDPRSAYVYCWTAKPLTAQTVTAIRDWAHREGYRSLIMAVHDETIPTLGSEAEADAYTQETCALIAES